MAKKIDITKCGIELGEAGSLAVALFATIEAVEARISNI
jgi:hypothetical protein